MIPNQMGVIDWDDVEDDGFLTPTGYLTSPDDGPDCD